MKRTTSVALILGGAVSLYLLGRWGGEAPSRDLLPLLGPEPALPAATLLGGLLALVVGILLLGRRTYGVPPPLEGPRLAPVQVFAVASGVIVLFCMVAVTLGASRGWSPKTLAVWSGVGLAEAVVGLLLIPSCLRAAGPRSVSLLSSGVILVGVAWVASVLAIGLGGG